MNAKLFKLMWAVVMVVLLVQPGCKKVGQSSGSMLTYSWQWVRSVGGIAGVTQTPQSEGYTQAIDFDENGSYTKYRDNINVASGTFTVTRAESQLDGQQYDMVTLDDGSEPMAVTMLSESQLILREDCFDCFTHTYQRN